MQAVLRGSPAFAKGAAWIFPLVRKTRWRALRRLPSGVFSAFSGVKE